jgi:hypothetical protein
VTVTPVDRVVNVVKEYRLIAGAVGIVAGSTAGGLHRVVVVQSLERGFVDLVALDAEAGLGRAQKPGVVLRYVWGVALEAVLFYWIVREFVLRDPATQRVVALEAQGAPGPDQDHLVVRGVRVVAKGALALREDLVDAARIRLAHVVVTLVAEDPGIGGEHHLVVRGVRIVATGAVPLGQRRMQVAPLQRLLERVVTLDAQLGPRALLQLEVLVRRCCGCRAYGEE